MATASLFGKLPHTLDFIRVNHTYPAAIAFDEWAEKCLQEIALNNTRWPAQRFRFLFAPARSAEAVVGVVAPSRDRAGRKFPVAILGPVSVDPLARAFAAVPLLFETFFAQCEELLEAAEGIPRAELDARVSAISIPEARLASAKLEVVSELLRARTLKQFAEGLFTPEPENQVEYALSTLRKTVSQVRSQPADRPTVIDCPVRTTEDVCAWLALLSAGLAWSSAAPSFFWNLAEDGPRLLVSLGPPPVLLPTWLGEPKRRHDRLCALHGARPELWDAAHGSLASLLGEDGFEINLQALVSALPAGPQT